MKFADEIGLILEIQKRIFNVNDVDDYEYLVNLIKNH